MMKKPNSDPTLNEELKDSCLDNLCCQRIAPLHIKSLFDEKSWTHEQNYTLLAEDESILSQ